jgi:hypothetical protein
MMPRMTADRVTTRYDEKFNLLFARGREAVLAGTHHRDGPLVEGGRWGISVLMRPDAVAAADLEAMAREALQVAGGGHWPTGSASTVHVTVLPMEPYREKVPDDDPDVARYVAGMHTAAGRSRPVRLRFGGLTLSPYGVMACAYPDDEAADELATNLKGTIGGNRFSDRDIWYATVLHFAGPVRRPWRLVDWVAARRRLDPVQTRIAEVDLVGWRSEAGGAQPVPVPLAFAPLAG